MLYAVIAVPVVGLALHWAMVGRAAMTAELQIWLLYGLAATGLVFLTVFAKNLACAPFRLEREAHAATKAELVQLRELTQWPRRTLSEAQKASLAKAVGEVHQDEFFVVYTPVSSEVADFASDIAEAVDLAGIKCLVHTGVFVDHDPRSRGVYVYYMTDDDAPTAQSVRDTFLGFGYAAKAEKQKGAGGVYIYVARARASGA